MVEQPKRLLDDVLDRGGEARVVPVAQGAEQRPDEGVGSDLDVEVVDVVLTCRGDHGRDRGRHPVGLQGRGGLWAVAMTVVGAAFGALGDSADELVGISDDLALALEGLADGSLVELYFTFAVGFLAIAASGFGVQAALRPRTEELGGRTESVLATAVSRRRCDPAAVGRLRPFSART